MIYALIEETTFQRYYEYLTSVVTNFENSSGCNVAFGDDQCQFPDMLELEDESYQLLEPPKQNPSELLIDNPRLKQVHDKREDTSLVNDPEPIGYINKNDETQCTLPKINPLDPSILEYISFGSPYKCGYTQPHNLFNLNDYGYITVNITYYDMLVQIYKNRNFSCLATTIDKMEGCVADTFITFSFYTIASGVDINRSIRSELITGQSNPYPVETDAAEVNCTITQENEKQKEIYYNVFGYPRNLTKSVLPTDDAHFSVHMLFTDSTSLSMFQRNLNKTFAFLTEELAMYVFAGFNKVADNTFPNVMPILTGLPTDVSSRSHIDLFLGMRTHAGDEDQPRELQLDYAKTFWDDVHYIWKNFSANGYVISFNEDAPDVGLFHYEMMGFKQRPVDHFYHSYYLAMQAARTVEEKKKYCFRNAPVTHMQLDILKRENKKYRHQRHFAYVFQTEISHNTLNDLGKYDDYYVKYFKEYSAQGYFDDKILFVLSDHGHRFSAIRSTLVGTLEERLPMLGIIIPPRFCKLYPVRCNDLKENREKLVTHFDLHETLSDIVTSNYDGKQRSLKERNLSLFYSIPGNRTCKRAGIPKFYCTCQNSEPINANDPVVIMAAKFAIDHINKLLEQPKTSNNITS